jgi:hypothetical protein
MLFAETIGFVCLTRTTPCPVPQLIDLITVSVCSQCGAVRGHMPAVERVRIQQASYSTYVQPIGPCVVSLRVS